MLPEVAAKDVLLRNTIAEKLNVLERDIQYIEILKRSIDARQRITKINLRIDVYIKEDFIRKEKNIPKYNDVSGKDEVIIIGAGPAGLFAALRLIEKGLRPIILERGKDVRARRRDLANLTKNHIVNEDSNYCFGEGGAGTFSDGKLYTRSKKRGDVNKILDVLVQHGAIPEIRINAHPHIGTNKLPKIIVSMREFIIECGGEVHFNTKVLDFLIKDDAIIGVDTNKGEFIANNVILATGHSARDIFRKLNEKKSL